MDTVKTEKSSDHATDNGKEIVKQRDAAGAAGFEQQHNPKCKAEESDGAALRAERPQPIQSRHLSVYPSIDLEKVPLAPVYQCACPWDEDTSVQTLQWQAVWRKAIAKTEPRA